MSRFKSAGMKTPDEKSAEQVFLDRAMKIVRDALYPGVSDSVFAREWPDLLLAVSEPPAYLHERGLRLPGSRYLAILQLVIAGIVAEGNLGRSRSKPMYLRKCMQGHLRAKGEAYLNEAKGIQTRLAGSVAVALVRKMRVAAVDPEAEHMTQVLVAARNLIMAPRRKP